MNSNIIARLIVVTVICLAVDELTAWYLNSRAEKFVAKSFDSEMDRIKSKFVHDRPTLDDVYIQLTWVNNLASRTLRNREQMGAHRERVLSTVQAYVDNWTPTA